MKKRQTQTEQAQEEEGKGRQYHKVTHGGRAGREGGRNGSTFVKSRS